MSPARSRRNSRSTSSFGLLFSRLQLLVRGPGRGLLIMTIVAAVIVGGGYAVWQLVGRNVLDGPQFWLHAADIVVTAQPAWIRSDVKAEVLRDASLNGPLSVLDDDLSQRINRAFAMHPWVADVKFVRKYVPARVEVELIYRRPVCMVEVPGGLYPVDAEAVLLPSADFSPIEARAYPRLSGIRTVTAGPVGTKWRDSRVEGAAAVAAALFDSWNELGLAQIVPRQPVAGSPPEGPTDYELVTSQGTRIRWGRAPRGEGPDEAAAAEKVARLKKHFAQHGSLDEPRRGDPLDVRSAAETAAVPRAGDAAPR